MGKLIVLGLFYRDDLTKNIYLVVPGIIIPSQTNRVIYIIPKKYVVKKVKDLLVENGRTEFMEIIIEMLHFLIKIIPNYHRNLHAKFKIKL